MANDGYTTDNQSAFFHVTYDFTERLRVSGGARYTDEEKTNTFDHGPALNRSDVPLVFGDSRTDWKVSVDFQLNDTMFLYAQAATGFTSEAATPRIFTVGQLMALQGEELVSNEIGAKLEFLDNRLRLNAAVFTSDYDPRVRQTGGVNQCDAPDVLTPVPYRLGGGNCPAEHVVRRAERPCAVCGFAVVLLRQLARDARRLRGRADGESRRKFADQLLLRPQRVRKHQQRSGADELHLRRSRLSEPNPSTPRAWASNTTVQLGNGGVLTPRLDAFYQSERHTGSAAARPVAQGVTANTCPQQCIPAYTLMNARLTFQPPNSDWRLSLAGTNITDEFYWQQYSAEITVNNNTGAITSTAPAGRSGVASPPREWALTIEKQF